MKFLNSKELKPIIGFIKNHYGITSKLDGLYHTNSKGKVYYSKRSVEPALIDELRIKALGIYIGQWKNDEFRFSVEGSQIFGPLCTRNICIISDENVKAWFRGEDIACEPTLHGFVVVKNGDDYLACGKAFDGLLRNFLSKSRYVKVL